jgi:hypothetical protein
MKENKKLIWQRKPQPGDEYALLLVNPQEVNIADLKRLFAKVRSARGGRRDHLSSIATQVFEQWLQDVSMPLPSCAYGLLSNWFLTDATVDRESMLGYACADFWDVLFAVRPHKRLTSIDRNSQVLDLPFEVWWGNQQKAQGQG